MSGGGNDDPKRSPPRDDDEGVDSDDAAADADAPVMMAGLRFADEDGNVHTELTRNSDGSPAPAAAATPPPAAPGRALGGGGGDASLSSQEMRSKRLAMMSGAKSPPPAASSGTPLRPRSPLATAARTPAPAAPAALPATPAPATPARTVLSPDSLMRTSITKEPNVGYLARYVLQAKRADSDLLDDNVPSLLTALFMGEHEDSYATLRGADAGALFDELDAQGVETVTEKQVESLLALHPSAGDDAFVIACHGRVKACLADSFVKQSFAPACAALAAAVRLHYLSNFIPCMLEGGEVKARTLRALLHHADPQAAYDVLEEICVHLSSDEEMGVEIVELVATYILHEDEKEVQAQGFPALITFCSFLVRLARSPAGAAVMSKLLSAQGGAPSLLAAAANPYHGVQFALQSWPRRFLLAPQPAEVRTLLTQVPNYPKTHPADTEPVLNRTRGMLFGVLRDVANGVLKEALLKKGAASQAIVLQWVRRALFACRGRTAITKNNLQRLQQSEVNHLYALNLAAVVFTLSDPVCKKNGKAASLSYVLSTEAAAHFPSWAEEHRFDREYKPSGKSVAVNFATHILFAGLEAMHSLVMPAVRVARWIHEQYMRMLSHAHQEGNQQGAASARLTDIAVAWDTLRLQLLNPSFVDMATQHAVTVCCVIDERLSAAEGDELPEDVLAMPVFMLEDALDWAVFVCNVCCAPCARNNTNNTHTHSTLPTSSRVPKACRSFSSLPSGRACTPPFSAATPCSRAASWPSSPPCRTTASSSAAA